ncbi:Outer membrane receptor proteins, mostly Fe transport [Chitinophaga sp. CF118]|uniref:TonB-dependent receptor n=1 Tax=Chitinophaga sp. CF118 TaxID=1884367 RepID=UPI0008E81D10|nr:TonB-dependent receptor [Chitinophaga sp. CF118]SFE15526.1 Outer membrane receptor proteins, mostly Fe transport [Chitinophaga sp. CF118]
MKLLKNISSLFFLLLTALLAAGQQTGVVYGTLSDTSASLQLKEAYISLHRSSDSSMQRSFFSGENGAFSSGQISLGHYYIRISYQGYQTLKVPFILDKEQNLNLGTIYMSAKVMVLDTIVVQEAAIIQNKDTLEYNASRFKTRDYAVLSELLKLLPGIQLNNDGSITINGQIIDQLMVDGKPFFDGTPAMALTHLPADIVKKIQVFASNNITNSGIPAPPGFFGNKTLNVVLKANKRKGNFGKVMAGAGSGGAYTGSADLNHMNGDQQTTLIGDAGNADNDKSTDFISTNNGIHRKINGALNYRDSRNEKISINGSIIANDLYNKTIERSHVINIFPGDSSTILDQNSEGEMHTYMQHINMNLEHKPDAYNTFTFQPRILLQHTNNNNVQQSIQRYENSGDTIYRSNGTNTSSGSNTMISSLLQYTHSWQQSVKKISLGVNFSGNNDKHNTTGHTETEAINLDQHSISKNNGLNIAPYLTFITPVGDKSILNIQGNYSYNRNAMSYRVFRLNESNQHFDELDSSQSNDFNSTYNTTAIQFSLRRQLKNSTVTVGSGIESDWIAGQNLTNHTHISRRFVNVLPSAMFTLNMRGRNNLTVSYNGKPMTVSVQQLQPVSITADSLFITEGNPDLQQPYIHSMNLGYTSLIGSNNRFFSATLTSSITMHSIQQSITLLDNGVQVSKPVNLEGARDVSLIINYGIPAIKSKSSFNFAVNATYSKNPVLSNGTRNDSRILFYSGTIVWNYRPANGFDLNLSTTPGYNSLQTGLGQHESFFTTAIGAKVSYIKGDWDAALSAYYNYNSSLPSNYKTKYPVTIPAVGYRFLKHKEGEIRLSVMDLFNQQSGASRSISSSSVSDTRSETRGRYILATFTYNFRKFGGKE